MWQAFVRIRFERSWSSEAWMGKKSSRDQVIFQHCHPYKYTSSLWEDGLVLHVPMASLRVKADKTKPNKTRQNTQDGACKEMVEPK